MNATLTTRLSSGSFVAVSRAGSAPSCSRALRRSDSWQDMSMWTKTPATLNVNAENAATTAVKHFATTVLGATEIATKPYVKRPKETLR